MTAYNLICVVLIALLSSCEQKIPTDKKAIEVIIPDTSLTHQRNDLYYGIKNLRRELNLKNLELGADSIEIRIYEDGALWRPERLIIIKNESGIWNATLITYWTREAKEKERTDDSTKSWYQNYNAIVDSTETINLNPNCSWNNLIDSLKIYNIFTLPSQEEIKGFQDKVNDGISYHFEIATRKRYRFYTYHCPDVYSDNDNKNVANILGVVSRQLTYVMLCKSDG